ncbi:MULTISPECIES: NAD(P)-binding domain-containing protein [unclassified Micromonospora]|uniref:NADPH-dependent F420 reductase n=1 Tax=unclassified Micromonospora TaxID=2617518 RepID=UPI001C21E54F|nr:MULTISPECIES: NAD(P)-binding domain-containing protein [unclassified Micromonospora]MBU8857279.1 NAD(P)-binding domain-containing protein [Micromonospora sp. WMMB482]MDM4782901.1 NAD(P)-binding domain-containing protein [Micromonospora sp. b486]
MRIAVLGTGMVGRAIATRVAELGHEVVLGTRDVAATRAGDWGDWAAGHPGVALAGHADATAGADLVVNATSGDGSLPALDAAGADNLAGKILLDIANPLDFSKGFPPTLSVLNDDSLGERIQRAFPRTRVVKALNTLTADLMTHPRQLADGDHSVFVSGDDAEAKKVVVDLLTSFGHTDVIDLGDITTARGTEMLLPIWLRLYGRLGTPLFNVRVVR